MTASSLSSSFLESSIILNTISELDLEKHSVISQEDFVVHQDAYDFLLKFFEKYQEFPTIDTYTLEFEDLEINAFGENLDYAIEIFCKRTLTRKATNIIRQYNKLILDNPEQAISDIITQLDNLNVGYSDEHYIYDDGSIKRLEQYYERQDKRLNSSLKIIGVPTPIRSINEIGLGLLPGEICSLIARPGVGKSWFAIRAAAICTARNYKTLFLTSEMTSEQMSLRFDVVMGNIMGYKFSHSALKIGDEINTEEYKKFLQQNSKKNLFIVDKVNEPIFSIVRKYKPEVLIIDNMELMYNGRDNDKMWEKMYNLYYGLKTLCTSNKIASFVTHQATREANDPFKPPNRNEISSGDALLRASDIVLSMCLVENDDKKRMLSFQKFRDIPEQKDFVYLDFDVDVGIFKEQSG